MHRLRHIFAGLFLIVLGSTGMAQEQSLGQAASDPTASLMSFQLQTYYSSSLYSLPGETSNRLQFRAAIPFSLGNTNNIARLTLPYVTDSPSGVSGFGDLTVFNLTVFDRPWGRRGCGAAAHR